MHLLASLSLTCTLVKEQRDKSEGGERDNIRARVLLFEKKHGCNLSFCPPFIWSRFRKVLRLCLACLFHPLLLLSFFVLSFMWSRVAPSRITQRDAVSVCCGQLQRTTERARTRDIGCPFLSFPQFSPDQSVQTPVPFIRSDLHWRYGVRSKQTDHYQDAGLQGVVNMIPLNQVSRPV